MSFESEEGFAAAGRHIYDIAVAMNGRGDVMPIWGTCLGFELLSFMTSRNGDPRVNCSSDAQAVPLAFTKGFRKSRLFGKAPEDIVESLDRDSVTVNFHHLCLTPSRMRECGLDQEWTVLSMNSDRTGLQFVSSMEHRQ